ncbi:MAG: hypothetical protein Q9172_000145 [Xanthocarpia lactea]
MTSETMHHLALAGSCTVDSITTHTTPATRSPATKGKAVTGDDAGSDGLRNVSTSSALLLTDLTTQNTPRMAPLRTAKTTLTANPFAGIHMAKHAIPQLRVERQCKVWQRVQKRDLPEHATERPQKKEPDIITRQELRVERMLRWLDDVVSILDRHDSQGIEYKGNDASDAQRPGKRDVFDHLTNRQREDDSAHSRPSTGNAIG